MRTAQERGRGGEGWGETERHRVRDENINPSTHTQTAHSPEGRNLQMALSYVWLLIKPSHRSLCVCCTAPSLIFLPHPSVPLCLCITHSQRRAHTRKRLYSGESPGFDQVLFDTIIRSEAQLVGPSLAVAPASRGISISISDVGLFSISPPPPVWNQHSFFPIKSSVSVTAPSYIVVPSRWLDTTVSWLDSSDSLQSSAIPQTSKATFDLHESSLKQLFKLYLLFLYALHPYAVSQGDLQYQNPSAGQKKYQCYFPQP